MTPGSRRELAGAAGGAGSGAQGHRIKPVFYAPFQPQVREAMTEEVSHQVGDICWEDDRSLGVRPLTNCGIFAQFLDHSFLISKMEFITPGFQSCCEN